MEQRSECFGSGILAKSRRADALILFAGVILGVLLRWTVIEIAIFSVFIWSVIGPVQSRFLAIPSLFFLSFTPILLLLEREAQAEEFAVYAYYFLVMAVIRGIVEAREDTTKK
jgi:hypothetical protein